MPTKDELRKKYTSIRRSIARNARTKKDAAIAAKLVEDVDWAAVRSMHIYDSQEQWGEVSTRPIIDYVKKSFPYIDIDIALAAYDIKPSDKLYDLIIVPVVAFDSDNRRLGMGKGWYDRFLSSQPRAIKIGIAYREQYTAHVPSEPHDVVLSRIITD